MSEVIKSPDLHSNYTGDVGLATPTASKLRPKQQQQKQLEEAEEEQQRLKAERQAEKTRICLKRCIRLPIMLMAAILTVYVSVLSSERYFKYWVQTSIERTDVHVSEIAFPAVTICPLKVTIANATQTPSERPPLAQLFNLMQSILWRTADGLRATPEIFTQHAGYDERVFENIYGFLNYSCEEFFAECEWRRQSVSCCSIFRRQSTIEGSCFAFNSVYVVNPVSTWPWSVASSGSNSALNVRLKRQLKTNSVESIGIIVHEPDQYLGSSVIYSTEDRVVVPVEPLRFTADPDVRSRPVAMRHCYFTQELGMIGQPRSECIRTCHVQYISQQCNCSYQSPLAGANTTEQSSVEPMRRCSVRDLPCFQLHRLSLFSMSNIIEVSKDNVFSTIDCGCYPNCDHTQYHTSSYTERFSSHGNNVTHIELDVYFQDETLFSYRSVLRFTFLDLMVSYGGIAGLFMGISVIGTINALLDHITGNRAARRQS